MSTLFGSRVYDIWFAFSPDSLSPEFASEGLRTLVLGVKILSKEDAEVWLTKYKAASTSIENREKKMTAVAVDIERDLHIVGATALEDELQDGVPETIANLKKAGIKLWVLTGDKRETAIEIGYSTKGTLLFVPFLFHYNSSLTNVAVSSVDFYYVLDGSG